MIEGYRIARSFNSLIIIFFILLMFIIIHLGFIIDIPYMPDMLCFRIPAIFFVTLLCYPLILTLHGIKARNEDVRPLRIFFARRTVVQLVP